MQYVPPGQPGSMVQVQPRYENFVGGKWLAPTEGRYRVNLSPATGRPITEVAHSTPADVELALDAAHAAKDAWGEASGAQRAAVLNAIADAIEKNKEMLAVAESWENGKPVGRPSMPTSRWWSTTSATLRRRPVRRRAPRPRSTRTWSHTTSVS